MSLSIMQTLAFENYTQITLHTRDLKCLKHKNIRWIPI